MSRAGGYVKAAVAVVIALGMIALNAPELSPGDLTAAPSVLFALVPLAVALGALERARRPHDHAPSVDDVDGHGVRFRYRMRAWWAEVVLYLSMLPMTVSFLVLGIAGGLPTGPAVVALLLGASGTATLAYVAVSMATGRMCRGEVHVTAAGVTNRTWAGEAKLSWEDMAGIEAVDEKGPRLTVAARSGRKAAWTTHTRFVRSDEERALPDLVVNATLVEGDAALLAHAVAWYLEHPDARAELASNAALRRVRAGEAVVARAALGEAV